MSSQLSKQFRQSVVICIWLSVGWLSSGISAHAFDSTAYPMPSADSTAAFGNEMEFVIHRYREDPTLKLRYYSLSYFSDFLTQDRVVQGSQAVVFPINESLSIPLLRLRSGRQHHSQIFIPNDSRIGVRNYEGFHSAGAIWSSRLVAIAALAGISPYRSDESTDRFWIIPIVDENRLTERIVGHFSVRSNSESGRRVNVFADVQLNPITYRDYTFDNLGVFHYSGGYSQSVTSNVYGLRLGSRQIYTEIGYRTFAGKEVTKPFDQTLFTTVRVDFDDIGLQLTLDRRNMPRVGIISRGALGADGALFIDVGQSVGPPEADITVTLAYTIEAHADGSIFPPSLRRQVYQGDYYDEIVREDDFGY